MKIISLKKTIAFFVLLVAALFIARPEAMASGGNRISVEELRKLMESKTPVVLIDVRTPEEFKEGHIPGAISMPLDTLEGVKTLPQGGKIILYCKSGRRSQEAFRILSAKGFKGLVDLEGGIVEWNESLKKTEGR
jgi:rhodanese-related sulfurtransferase